MNSRGRKIYSLLALALTGCVAGERHITRVEKSWPAGEVQRVEIREVDGSINIHGDATDKVVLNARLRTYGEPKPDLLRAELHGDTLVIGRRNEHGIRVHFFGWNEPHIDYDISVPPNVELALTTVNGRITTRAVAGEMRAITVNGSLDLETDGTKEVTAKSVNGRILCRFKKDFQGASFKTVNGRVVAMLPPNASFYGDFKQVNGDFEAAFPLDIQSHPGSRRVSGEVNGGKYELKITTVNGDIKVENSGLPVPPPPAVPGTIPAPPPPPAPNT